MICFPIQRKMNSSWKVSLGRRNADVHIFKALRDGNEIAIGYGADEDITDWDGQRVDASDKADCRYCTPKLKLEISCYFVDTFVPSD